MLILRSRVKKGMSFKQLLLAVKDEIQTSIELQNFPIETLSPQQDKSGETGEFPLFDTAVLLENIHDKDYLSHINLALSFNFSRKGEDIEGELEYMTQYFKKAAVEKIISNLYILFEEVLFNVEKKTEQVSLLKGEERTRLVDTYNPEDAQSPDLPVHRLFEIQVEKTPGNIALIDTAQNVGTSGRTVTYRELNRRANRLAHYLIEKGNQPETITAVILERSAYMVTAILGILKSGGAYLPIDPNSPVNRIHYLLEDSRATRIVTTNEIAAQLQLGEKAILVDDETQQPERTTNPGEDVSPENLCYIIYTSG
ncbi:MAG: AMP-binding protein, partial [bacterium]|nr:AMP-binding protein [bacterium]